MDLNNLIQLTEEQLDEVRMSPSAINKFLSSPEAAGIRAGFEAELIFRGINEPSYAEEGLDYDMDERTYSIQQIVAFFRGGDLGISNREGRELSDRLEEEYLEWREEALNDRWNDEGEDFFREYVEENSLIDLDDLKYQQLEVADWDDEEISNILDPEMRRQNPAYEKAYQLATQNALEDYETAISELFDTRGRDYDDAYSEWVDQISDEFDVETWLDDNYRYMTDIETNFNLYWPYVSYNESGSGNFNINVAENLASSLKRSLSEYLPGMKVIAQEYHSSRPTGNWEKTWYIESDGSLTPDYDDDLPAEIVSPPLPLAQTLKILPLFFSWASEQGAYANDSTGFHMGVSLGNRGTKTMYSQGYGGRVATQKSYDFDYLKAILFLGEEHLLLEFGRLGNVYAEQGANRVKNLLRTDPKKLEAAFNLMHKGLIELASDAISKTSLHKYTTINPHENYVEFRIAGGDDYFEEIEKLQQTLSRYAYVMHIAGNNNLYREEYYKKLYKFLSKIKNNNNSDIINLFAQYTAGMLDKQELKMAIHQKRIDQGKSLPQRHKYYIFRVEVQGGYYRPLFIIASNTQEAMEFAWQEWAWIDNDDKSRTTAKIVEPYEGPDIPGMFPQNLENFNKKDWISDLSDEEFDDLMDSLSDEVDDLMSSKEPVPSLEELGLGWLKDFVPSEKLRRTAWLPDLPDPKASPSSDDNDAELLDQDFNYEWTGKWLIRDLDTNEILHTVSGIGNVQADANRFARNWLVTQPESVRSRSIWVVPEYRYQPNRMAM